MKGNLRDLVVQPKLGQIIDSLVLVVEMPLQETCLRSPLTASCLERVSGRQRSCRGAARSVQIDRKKNCRTVLLLAVLRASNP